MTTALTNLLSDTAAMVEDQPAPLSHCDQAEYPRSGVLEVLGDVVALAKAEDELDHPAVRLVVDVLLDELGPS